MGSRSYAILGYGITAKESHNASYNEVDNVAEVLEEKFGVKLGWSGGEGGETYFLSFVGCHVEVDWDGPQVVEAAEPSADEHKKFFQALCYISDMKEDTVRNILELNLPEHLSKLEEAERHALMARVKPYRFLAARWW